MTDSNPFSDPNYGLEPGQQAAVNPFSDPNYGKEEKSSLARRVLGDGGISLLKGAISVPEAAVGLADIVTGGRAGKAAEGIGLRPAEAKQILDEYRSPEQKAASQAVSQADGFVDTLGAVADNPSVIPHALLESAPLIAGGGIVGRGVTAVAPKVAPWAAGAIGEGAVMAGSQAENIRNQTDDGLLTGKQSLAALGTGVAGGLIGAGGAALGRSIGLGDIDTAMVSGAMGQSSRGATARIAGGAAQEGLLEEMPQSAAEQALQNYALDREIGEGVGGAAAMGLVTGGAMGAGFGAVSGNRAQQDNQAADPNEPPPLVVTRGADTPDQIQPTPSAENPVPLPVERPDPNNGVLSRAVNLMPSAAPVLDTARIERQLGGIDQGMSQPASPEEARIREAMAAVETRARLGGMNPVLAAERARLGGELVKLQQQAAEAGQRDSDVIDVDLQPAIGRDAAQARLERRVLDGELVGGSLQPQQPSPSLSREGVTIDAYPLPPKAQRALSTSFKTEAAAARAVQGLPAPERFTVEPQGEAFVVRLLPAPAAQEQLVEAPAATVTIGRQPKAKGQRRSVDRDRDSVVQAAIRLGGITKQWKQDTTGDTVGNKNIPGIGALWSDNTGTSLDDMASLLDQHGYVPAGEMDKDGGVSWLQSAIRQELAGQPSYAPDSARQIEQVEAELLNRYAEDVARAIDQREAEYARIESEYGPDAADDARSYDQAIEAYAQQLEGAIEDAREPETDTILDGEPLDQAGAARRDDELREVDERESRAAGEAAESFDLRQQTEAELAEQARQQQEREQAEAKARAEADEKARKEAERAAAKQQNDAANAEFQLGQDAEQNLSGQRGMFDEAPAEQQAVAPQEATKYSLPNGRVSDDWEDANGRRHRHPDYEPSARQKILIDAVRPALDDGVFYDRQLRERVSNDLGVPADVLDRNESGVQGGDFAYDIYLARQHIEAQAGRRAADKATKEMRLQVGEKLGVLRFNDLKYTSAVVVTAVEGNTVTLQGKRGATTIRMETDASAVAAAMDRAFDGGKRSDNSAAFKARKAGNAGTAEPTPIERMAADAGTTTDQLTAPANWRKNFIQARQYAKALGVPVEKGQKLAEVVAVIEAKLGGEPAPKEQPATPAEQQPRKPATDGNSMPDNENMLADQESARLRQIGDEFGGTYKGRSLSPVAREFADHAIQNGRRMTSDELSALAEKHDIPVDVIDQLSRNAYIYEGLLQSAQLGDQAAKAVLKRARLNKRDNAQPARPQTEQSATAEQDRFGRLAEQIRAAKVGSMLNRAGRDEVRAISREIAAKTNTVDADKFDSWIERPDLSQQAVEFARGILAPQAVAEAQPAEAETAEQSAPKAKPRAKRAAKPAESKIEDTGDQLKFNKKNMFRSGGLKWDDIASENEAMKVKLAGKEKIWARPNWEQIIESQPEDQRAGFKMVAHLVKQVYDALPKQSTSKTDAGLQQYIATVTELRDAADALLGDSGRAGEVIAAVAEQAQRRMGGSFSIGDALRNERRGQSMPLFQTLFPAQAAGARFERGTPANDKAGAIGNKAIKAMQWNSSSAVDAMKAIKAGWPAKQEAWQKQGYAVFHNASGDVKARYYESTRGEIWASMEMGGRTVERVGEDFKGRAAAEAAANARLAELDGKFLVLDKRKTLLGAFAEEEAAIDFARSQTARKQDDEAVDEVMDEDWDARSGEQRRPAGKDVSEVEFKEAFGFRGVNFGKWVKQDERQRHLNAAYDGFVDLAEVMGLPPKAISLNGMLGVAFGAQGGGKFAAHFVPGVNEINLTKTRGAGALAHEWAHALDHYFGVQAGLARETEPFASVLGGYRRDKDGREIRPEVAEAFKSLVSIMQSRQESPDEVIARRQANLKDAKERVTAEADRLRPRLEGNADALAALDKVVEGEVGEYVNLPIPKGKRKPIGAIPQNIKTVYDALGYSSEQMDSESHKLHSVHFAREELNREVLGRKIHTQFYKNSQVLDAKKKPYWSTQWEMFARAFETWVADSLGESGKFNNYLVRSNKRNQDADSPYPAGVEREAINQAFSKLVADLKHRQPDESGNVALYRLSDTQARGIPLMSARMIAGKLADSTGLRVSVADDESGLPSEVRAQIERDGVQGRVAGVYHNGTSWLIAANLRDTQHAASVVLHEAIGHGGVKVVLGERIGRTMRDIYRDMPQAQRAELESRYAGQLEGLSAASQQELVAEEYVANLAETDPRNSIVGRMVALLRQFIRRVLGESAAMKWTRNDLVQLLAEARSAARNGESNGQAGQTGAADGRAAYRAVAARQQGDAGAAAESSGEVDGLGFVEGLSQEELAGMRPFAGAMYRSQQTDSPFFRRWFGKSLMKDQAGTPVEFWHRSFGQIDAFDDGRLGSNTGTATAALGHFFAMSDVGNVERYGPDSEPFFLRLEKPKLVSMREFEAMGEWSDEFARAYKSRLQAHGHDGIFVKGLKWAIVFEGRNVKASRNAGAFDESGSVRYSLADDADTREALRKLGLAGDEAAGVIERIRNLTLADLKAKMSEWATRSREGLFDGLDGIRRAEEAVGVTAADQQGYVSARMASGIADVMHGVLHYAAPEWRDGVIAGKADTRGVLDILGDLGPDNLTPWLAWLGGKRGQLLKAQGRENNLTDADIAELLAMADGREALFERVYREYARVNDAVLDLAEQAGLIDSEARAKWATEYYVPFYRQQEGDEGLFSAPRTQRGLSHQTAAIKALKGGKLPTNDLLGNMLAGWTKRIDASMKNKALLEVVDNLKGSDYLADESPRYQQVLISRSQIAAQIRQDRKAQRLAAQMLGMKEGANTLKVLNELMKPQNDGFEKLWTRVSPTDPDIIRVQRAGKNEYYRVADESLLRGLKFMEGSTFNDPITRIGRTFKRLLTTGVTASPDFILRNFIRDAAHAWMINKDGFALGKDSLKGMRDALREDQDYRDLMFAGGSFQGGYVHGTDPEASAQIIRRALEKKGFTRPQQDAYLGSIVNTPAKVASMLGQGWQKYRTLGDKVENANRLSTYKAALAAGKSKRQAAYEAKDLMDYSLRGNFAAAQWFTDVVPFLNARLQGLYKLGRAVKGDKGLLAREVAMKGAYIALFSLLLAGLNDDDDRYQELQDWDKDMHWHIFLGEEHFRIPKPFELGLIFGTVPERLLHAATGSQDGGDLAKAVSQGVFQTLAFNPVPQFYQPIRELQANRNFFRDMPIEDMSDEGKLPEARYDERTSALSRAAGQLTGPAVGLSPKQLDHLVMGYTGTLGGYVLSMSNVVAGAFSDAERPDLRAGDLPVVKVLYQGDAVRSTQYQTEFYDMMGEAEQMYRTINAYRAEGKVEEAAALFEESRDKLRHRPALGFARKQLGNIRKQMDQVYRDENMDGSAKRERLDALQLRANAVAERVVRLAEKP